jgi:hypothetical protein
MSYHLFSKETNKHKKFSKVSWPKVLELAKFYDWEPLGTRPPQIFDFYGIPPDDWDGNYLTNDEQTVMNEDALALAIALEDSLDDIPDFNIEIDRSANNQIADNLPEWLTPWETAMINDALEIQSPAMNIHPFEYFAGNEKQRLMEFIEFCRLGSFHIA